MLTKGQYVRHRMAPDILMGTVEEVEIQRGRVLYRFRQDPRLREPLSGIYGKHRFLDDELEPCDCPSDEYWANINRRIGLLARRAAA